MANARVRRGRETEAIVAAFLREAGWPFAERCPASLPGSDIVGCDGLNFEVKARRNLDIMGWLRQAKERKGLPILIHRPDGYGPATVADWPATLPLKVLLDLLLEAGYGDYRRHGGA